MENRIILVDEMDREVGTEEKLAAHQKPMLHRAFSVFLYDDSGDETMLLLQQRAIGKYHSGGLWANACCSHPAASETVLDAAVRRLREELGITGVCLKEIASFIYFHQFKENLFEFEYDHVLVGRYSGAIEANKEEIEQVKWVTVSELQNELSFFGDTKYAPWFPMASSFVLNWLLVHAR